MTPRQLKPLAERFWAKVDRREPEECWPWVGATLRAGYGVIGLRFRPSRNLMAHRLSWELHNGPILGGLHVCHRCDNPSCVNPAHLFLGTNADNRADSVAKGRHPKGERHHRAKLTATQILEIRPMPGPHKRIAKKFGVSQALISLIKQRKIWSHVP